MFDINISIFKSINNLGIDFPFLNPFFVFFAEYCVPLLALFLIYHWFFKKNRKAVLLGSVIFIPAELLAKTLIGSLHFNYQPFFYLPETNLLITKELNNSFPSDHTILIFSFMLAFMYFSKNKTQKTIYFAIATLVSLSRIGVGVHFPFDVLVSFLLTIILLIISIFLNKKVSFLDSFLIYYDKFSKSFMLKLKK